MSRMLTSRITQAFQMEQRQTLILPQRGLVSIRRVLLAAEGFPPGANVTAAPCVPTLEGITLIG